MTKILKKNQLKKTRPQLKDPRNVAFIEHVRELRRRLVYIAASVLIWSTAAYFIQQQLVSLLLRPAKGQRFIYTSPGGGINFLFQVCLYFGIVLSIPVIIYQLLKFVEPAIKAPSKQFISRFSTLSGVLALVGIVFGYFMGLPLALHFLSHQFTTSQIQPLFTIQEYMSFVMIYLVGSALLFQIPLVISFINRAKPLQPRRLLHYERHVIVAAFVIAVIMAPTTNILYQLIIAGPIILSYQISIGLVWLQNGRTKRHYPKRVQLLLQQDQERQAKRRAAVLQPLIDDEPWLLTRPGLLA